MRFLLFFVLLVGGPAIAQTPKVVTDIAPVHSLVAQVMKGIGEPKLMIKPSVSPHHLSLRPRLAKRLSNADLLIVTGKDLIGWLPKAMDKVSTDTPYIALLEVPQTQLLKTRTLQDFAAFSDDMGKDHTHDDDHHDDDMHDHGEKDDHHDDQEYGHKGHEDHENHADHADHQHHENHADHADHQHHENHADHKDHKADEHHKHKRHRKYHGKYHGKHHRRDIHNHPTGEYDPHAWLSPENAKIWLDVIAEKLSEIDPDNRSVYMANAQQGRDNISAAQVDAKKTLMSLPSRDFFAFHDATQYFEHAFDVKAIGTLSSVHAQGMRAGGLRALKTLADTDTHVCLIIEPQFKRKRLRKLTKHTGISVAKINIFAPDRTLGPDLYPNLIRQMADSLKTCLTPKDDA